MNRKITFSLLLLIVSIEVVAQVKKTGPATTATPVSKTVVGMLKPEDYKTPLKTVNPKTDGWSL